MITYSLQISFDRQSIQQVKENNQKLILVKQVQSGLPTARLAWVMYEPSQENQIQWNDQVQIYTSTNKISPSQKIIKNSISNSLIKQHEYIYSNGEFNETLKLNETYANAYRIKNASNSELTFGLTQDVVVNDQPYKSSLLNAITIQQHYMATFACTEKITIFLHPHLDLDSRSSINSGIVLLKNKHEFDLDFSKSRNQHITYINQTFISI